MRIPIPLVESEDKNSCSPVFILWRFFFFTRMKIWCAIGIDFNLLTVTPGILMSTNSHTNKYSKVKKYYHAKHYKDRIL